MGQAQLKLQRSHQQLASVNLLHIEKIALAIRKLCLAASGHFGADCYVHAALAKALLKNINIDSEIVAGEAAWRIGEGDGDMIKHANDTNIVNQDSAFPYHAWVEFYGMIFDVTTYQLSRKAQQLDALDGGHTMVSWCPDYLFVKKNQSSSLHDVSRLTAGLFHYRRDALIAAKIKTECIENLDPKDLEYAQFIYHNPQVSVFGPNHSVF